jgi:hypothetical protein
MNYRSRDYVVQLLSAGDIYFNGLVRTEGWLSILPKLIKKAMSTDTDTLIQLIGKNEQVKKVFWSVFVILAGFVLAQVVEPEVAREILALITGAG